nr:MAG: movement protein [Actinidia virus B]
MSSISQGSSSTTSSSMATRATAKSSKIFDAPKGEDGKSVARALNRDRVYKMDVFEKIFHQTTLKSCVHDELVVENGVVDQDIDLVDEKTIDGLNEETQPYIHLGCVAIAVIPHGRAMKGTVQIKVEDQRFKEGHGTICSFKCDLKDALSAYASFPGYFVSTTDVKNGYALNLKVRAEGMCMVEGVHPLSIQMHCIMKVCDANFEHRYALAKLKPGAYQELLNSQQVPGFELPYRKQMSNAPTGIKDTLVMPNVYDAIRKLHPNHVGGYIKDGQPEEGDRGTGADRSGPGT